jgi:hypothetical protein
LPRHSNNRKEETVKPIRRLAAALTLTTLAIFGLLTVLDGVTTPPDTTWGAPEATTVDVSGTLDAVIPVPLDTTWG